MANYQFKNMGRWAAKIRRRITYMQTMVPARIMEEQQKTRENGGPMPVVSGELRESLVIDVDGKLFIGAESYLSLLGMRGPITSVRWGWTVPYADRINYGFMGEDSLGRVYNQAGVHYIEYGESLRKQIVEEELKYARRIR